MTASVEPAPTPEPTAEPTSVAETAEEPWPARPDYMPGVDLLRGLLAIGVIAHHTLPFGAMGALAVPVFFVLSGYLLGEPLLRIRGLRAGVGRSWWRFEQRRWLRILPLYYVAVLIEAVIGEPKTWDLWARVVTLTVSPFRPKPFELLGGLGPVWSLAIEEQYYLLVPLLLLLPPRRWLGPVLAVAWAGAVAWRVTLMADDPPRSWLALSTLPGCLDAFVVGIVAAWAHREGALDRDRVNAVALAGAVCWLVAGAFRLTDLGGADASYHIDHYPGGRIGLTLLGIVAILYAARPDVRVPGGEAFAHWLGSRSYAVYLLHSVVPVPLAAWLLGLPSHGHPTVPLFVLSVAFTLAMAELGHRVVERPVERIRRRLAWPV